MNSLRRISVALVVTLTCMGSSARTRAATKPVLVGYFPQWGVYNNYFVKNLVASGGAAALDQINYAQAFVVDNRCAVADPNADMRLSFTAVNSVDGRADAPQSRLQGNFHQLQELRRLYPHVKILISLEGKADGFAAAAQPGERAAFVASCVQMFVRGHLAPGINAPGLFDGFDIDWEYPSTADKDNYLALLKEFRRQMKKVRPGLWLTIAGSQGIGRYQGFDLKAIAREVNQIGVMNYDYNGPWSHTTGILAPLHAIAGDPQQGDTVEATFQGYEQAGVPPSKLLIGIPLYAYGWSTVGETNHGLFQAGEAIRGDHPYSYIQSIEAQSTLYRDPVSQAPWLYDGKSFWTFDDPVSIRAKIEFARQHKLAGAMVWELSNDSSDAVLLKTIKNALKGVEPVRSVTAAAAQSERGGRGGGE